MATMLPPSVIKRGGGAGQRHQRVGADIVRHAERLAGGVHKFALQRVLGREGDGVKEQIQFAELCPDFCKNAWRYPRPW